MIRIRNTECYNQINKALLFSMSISMLFFVFKIWIPDNGSFGAVNDAGPLVDVPHGLPPPLLHPGRRVHNKQHLLVDILNKYHFYNVKLKCIRANFSTMSSLLLIFLLFLPKLPVQMSFHTRHGEISQIKIYNPKLYIKKSQYKSYYLNFK